MGIVTQPVNWVLDADISGFFDAIDHEWMLKFLEHRIADRRILRLNPEKTRLIEFGRQAAKQRRERGEKRPEPFTFWDFGTCMGRTEREGS